MIYKIKIENREFIVEVGDVNSRPIVAMVDDTRVEIWPHEAALPTGLPAVAEKDTTEDNQEIRQITAPMPGTIVAIAVKPGSEVVVGQLLCTLEAMKMQNPIRSPRKGVVAKIYVNVGQSVSYKDLLVDFEA